MDKINNSTNKNATAMDLFGKRGATVGVILSETGGDVDALTEKLEGADGAAKKMADTMLNNLSGDITKAGSAWEGFILSLEDGNGIISKIARSITQEFTGMLSQITALNEQGLSGLGQNIMANAKGASDEINGLGLSMAQLTAAAEQDEGIFNSLSKAYKSNEITLKQYKAGVEALAGGYKRLTDEEKQEAIIAQKRANLKKAKAFSDEEKAAFKTAGATREFTKAEIEATEKAKRLADALTFDLLPSKDEMSAALQAGIDAIKSSDSYTGGEPMKLQIPAKIELQPEQTQEGGAVITGEMIKLGEQAGEALSSSLKGAASGALIGLGEAIGTGSIADFGQVLIGGFANLLKSFGEQMIQLGLAMLALKAALALGPLGAGLAIGGGVALVAAAAAIQSNMAQSSAKPFANGGIVGSPTMGLVGEYAGARHNPEVIAPLDKLQGMLGSSGNMQEIRVTGKLVGRGKDMIGIINEAVKVNKYSS